MTDREPWLPPPLSPTERHGAPPARRPQTRPRPIHNQPLATGGAAVLHTATTPQQRAAVRRMLGGIRVPTRDNGPVDPVLRADAMTSMCDARAALNMTRGVPLEHIDSLGYRRPA